jgi:hypothetical protein
MLSMRPFVIFNCVALKDQILQDPGRANIADHCSYAGTAKVLSVDATIY